MLLAVDVGNSHTVAGLFDGWRERTADDQPLADWRIHTHADATPDELALAIGQLLSLRGLALAAVDLLVVSTVVPALERAYAAFAARYLGCEVVVVRPGIRSGIRVAIDNPREVGADRIVNAVAAYERFGAACIVVDLGTATTFDAISDDGAYIGGAIAPGIGISIDALVSHAARLASVDLRVPERAIGTNTVASMQSGALLGAIALVEGMLERFRAELDDPQAPAIATGGYGALIAGHVRGLQEYDPQLTLRGLRLIARRHAGLDD